MTWTYNADFEEERDQVRLYIGDTNSSKQLLSDEEIEFLIEQEQTTLLAAARAADLLANKYASQVSWSADGIKVETQELQARYERLAESLRAANRGTLSEGLPYFGGASRSDQMEDEYDYDLIPLHFGSHMHDNPAAGQGYHNDGDERNESGWRN